MNDDYFEIFDIEKLYSQKVAKDAQIHLEKDEAMWVDDKFSWENLEIPNIRQLHTELCLENKLAGSGFPLFGYLFNESNTKDKTTNIDYSFVEQVKHEFLVLSGLVDCWQQPDEPKPKPKNIMQQNEIVIGLLETLVQYAKEIRDHLNTQE